MGSISEEIAKNLMFYRKRAGLTQKQLADTLHVTKTSVSNWETAKNAMDIETLFAICDLLNVSVKEMYGKYVPELDDQNITYHERNVLRAYRAQPEMQAAVDRLLNVSDDDTETGDN